jgi:hypothetical protein
VGVVILKHWCDACGVYHCADRVSQGWRFLLLVVALAACALGALVR